MASNRTEKFAEALNAFESGQDLDEFVRVFADDVELHRPETHQRKDGDAGARSFWQDYLATFETIHSDFSRVTDAEIGVLEWTSTGTLSGGDPISYSGVSILDFDQSDQVARFTTYFDTSAFGVAPRASV